MRLEILHYGHSGYIVKPLEAVVWENVQCAWFQASAAVWTSSSWELRSIGCWLPTPEGGIYRLSRNVGNQLPTYAV